MTEKYRILITTSGAKGVPAMIRDLKKSNDDFYIVTADSNPEAIGNFFSNKSYVVPAWTEESYIPNILKIVEEEKTDYILTNDGPDGLHKLCVLANEQPNLKISVSKNQGHLAIAADKGELYNFLHNAGMTEILPAYKKVTNKADLAQAIINFGYPAKTVAIKPAQAEGARGFRIIREHKENVFETKSGSRSLTLAELEFLLANIDGLPEILVMEYLPGKEYSVDVLVDSARQMQYAVPRVRAEISEGLATVAIVEQNEELITITKQILEKLELIYALNFQFKYDVNGKPKLLEINPRLGGTMTCCVGAGVNIHYHLLLAMASKPIPLIEIKYGTKMYRFYDEKYINP